MTTFLDKMNDARKAIEEGGVFETLPPGKYLAVVDDCVHNTSKQGRDQVYIQWSIQDGDFTGNTHRSYYNLEHNIGIQIMIQDFMVLGEDMNSVNDEGALDAVCSNILGKKPQCLITLKESNGKNGQVYINTKINEFLQNTSQDSDSISAGDLVKYNLTGKVLSGTIDAVDSGNNLVTIAGKNIPLSDIVEKVF